MKVVNQSKLGGGDAVFCAFFIPEPISTKTPNFVQVQTDLSSNDLVHTLRDYLIFDALCNENVIDLRLKKN